jgi:cell division protein FtsB
VARSRLSALIVHKVTKIVIGSSHLYEDQQEQITALRAENEQLRKQNKILEARLDQILVLANLE